MQKSSSTTSLVNAPAEQLQRCIILCKVIDNFGDAGVTWRLAKQLAYEHGIQVELWLDDLERAKTIGATSFVSASPSISGSVILRPWTSHADAELACQQAFEGLGAKAADLVIAAFACETPEALWKQMQVRKRQTKRPPRWLNLEYLSAETWVDTSHLLGSPKHGLTETFYFPGWFESTGGLLRERQVAFGLRTSTPEHNKRGIRKSLLDLTQLELPPDLANVWTSHVWVSLFCYHTAPVQDLVQALRDLGKPVLLWVPHGVATKALQQLELFASQSTPHWFTLSQVIIAKMPMLTQEQYDHLLRESDLNCVRGEDSLVRAVWAAKPFLWQAYPQEEDSHHPKINAYHDRVLSPHLEPQTIMLSRWWNGMLPKPRRGAPLVAELRDAMAKVLAPTLAAEKTSWEDGCQALARHLSAQTDLATRLVSLFKNAPIR